MPSLAGTEDMDICAGSSFLSRVLQGKLGLQERAAFHLNWVVNRDQGASLRIEESYTQLLN